MTMLAKLGHDVLAASALIFSIQLSIMVTGMSLLFSISVLVGHAFGAKNYNLIGNYFQQGWTLAVIISLPLIFIFWHMDKILFWLGQSKTVIPIVTQYFHGYEFAVLPVLLSVCNQQFGYGIHQKKLIISISLLSVVVLLTCAYVLIFGKFGFPQLGVKGLAYATAAQSLFFVIMTTLYFRFKSEFKRYELFRYRVHHSWTLMSKMLTISWPITIQVGG